MRGVVTDREADDLVREAEAFLALVARTLGVVHQPAARHPRLLIRPPAPLLACLRPRARRSLRPPPRRLRLLPAPRREQPGGAGGAGRRPRPGRARAHRPRRALRRGALRARLPRRRHRPDPRARPRGAPGRAARWSGAAGVRARGCSAPPPGGSAPGPPSPSAPEPSRAAPRPPAAPRHAAAARSTPGTRAWCCWPAAGSAGRRCAGWCPPRTSGCVPRGRTSTTRAPACPRRSAARRSPPSTSSRSTPTGSCCCSARSPRWAGRSPGVGPISPPPRWRPGARCSAGASRSRW